MDTVTDQTDDILALDHLGKTFRVGFWGTKVQAVKDVSLTLKRGESLGYLGPNGCGKTTSIKCILSLIQPTTGKIRLFGADPSDASARARVGYLPEAPYFYDYLKPTEVLDYVGKLYGLDAATRKKRIPMLLDRLGLSHALNRELRGFSKGMLQRVGIAQSLLSDPDLLIYDEPLSGLDPIGRKEVRELMAELRREGKSLFFSSHVLTDIETLCDSVCILDRGEVVAQGRLSELLRTDKLESEALIDASPEAQAKLLALAGVQLMEQTGDVLRLRLPTDAVPALTAAIVESHATLRELSQRRESLEELFVQKAVHMSTDGGRARTPGAA
jgi:ABC-2 type transport system ATP-binding protein